ncbi:CHRD domain-containing protein [Fulvivirgaceae bacterium PWU4]|uniref:CHRD domain-containing protein n=1 Tax=Chryseosolibacter histidini TaxID=2782349 RepID=A0AAP2DK75_9BACT|nr:CHRD domain-containing protein [Chryseosolibacter histidini]MBT1697039.1 CHRD domain-containing protein [Chryseosolibacter histidini]
MKTLLKSVLITLLSAAVIFLSGCDDDESPKLTGDNKVYELGAVGNATASGTVTFAKRDDGKTLITIQLSGTQGSAIHPAHIHANTAAEGGAIVVSLQNVSGSSGKSETVVSAMDDGTMLSYDELIAFDGYVNVHASEADLATLVAQGDIGQNALTGDSKTYNMGPVSNPAISGTVRFQKRTNNETLVTLSLTGTTAGGDHPAHIHNNSVATGGSIALDLTNVNGTTGKSVTNVTKLRSGAAITYDQLITFNGYAQVHLSAANLATILANGNIGSNAP